MKYHPDLHWIFSALENPKVFTLHEGAVIVHDRFAQLPPKFHFLTTDGHFCRHAYRVITSAVTRFESTVDPDGSRISLVNLPKNLQDCAWLDTEEQAAKIALRRFLAVYDPNQEYPDCTMSLAKFDDDPNVLWPYN